MKCPKCGYISFDYNQACPKCNKNIADERDRLNLPSYKPSPPSLLGALTGEAGDSHPNLDGGATASGGVAETGFSPEDSQAIEAMEEAFRDKQSLDVSESIELSESAEDVPDSDLEELSLEEQVLDDDFILEPDAPSEKPGQSSVAEPSVVDENAVDIDLDELSETESSGDAKKGSSLELEDLASLLGEDKDARGGSAGSKENEGGLDLEDLDLDLEMEEPENKSS